MYPWDLIVPISSKFSKLLVTSQFYQGNGDIGRKKSLLRDFVHGNFISCLFYFINVLY